MSDRTNAVELGDDVMTLARVERWLGKFADMPDDKVSFAVKCCDFLMGIIAFKNEQIERMRALEAAYRQIAKESAWMGHELNRIASEPVKSYRVRIPIEVKP